MRISAKMQSRPGEEHLFIFSNAVSTTVSRRGCRRSLAAPQVGLSGRDSIKFRHSRRAKGGGGVAYQNRGGVPLLVGAPRGKRHVGVAGPAARAAVGYAIAVTKAVAVF